MIGGDLQVDKYRFRARPQNKNFILFPANPAVKPKSMFSIIMLLLKVALDTDPFFMYEDMFKCGVLILILIMFLIQLSIHLFTRCWFYGTSYNFPDIWTCVFGSKAFKFVPILLNIISYLTYTCWFNFEYHECLKTFILLLWPKCPSFLTNKWFLLYFINIITTFPCLFITNFSTFTVISYIGNTAMIVAFICLLILLGRSINDFGFQITVNTFGTIDEDTYGLPYLPFTTLFSKDVSALFGCIGTVMTAFYSHPFLESIFCDMRNPTVYRCLSAVWITSIISVIIFFGIGIISYFIIQIHFRESYKLLNSFQSGQLNSSDLKRNTSPYSIFELFNNYMIFDLENENIFFDFPKSCIEAMIGQVASYIVTITSNMVYTYFLATQLSSLVIDRRKDDIPPLVISGIVIILFSIGINFMNDSASSYLDFISQIAFLILVFVLPSVFYLKLFRFTKKFWGVVSIALLVVGVPISVAVIYYSAIEL